MRCAAWLLLCLVVIPTSAAFAGADGASPGPPAADAVDELVQAAMDRQHIPGLSLAVVKEGKVVKARGYGLANVELKVPATVDTVFQIASVSKQFVAAGILLLVEDGKVDLDEKVSKYLDGTPESWKEITVRQLMTHTAGMVRDDPLDRRTPVSEEQMLKAVAGMKLNFAPGTSWAYSNVGFNLLSMVIEKASGKPWDVFLKERIFVPLGMSSTRRYNIAEIVPNRAAGYMRQKDDWQNPPALPRNLAAGALLSTVTDMVKWDAGLRSEKLLKKASLDQMWTPAKLTDGSPAKAQNGGYGFGWRVSGAPGHKLVDHSGARPGFTSYIGRFVDDDLTVILLANLNATPLPPLGSRIAAVYVPALKP